MGKISRWLFRETGTMCGDQPNKNFLRGSIDRRPDEGRRFFCVRDSWWEIRNQERKTPMNRKPAIRIRPENPDHHLWNNNGTWWCHYTEHLPDYTKRRVRQSLLTKDRIIARFLRDSVFFEVCSAAGSQK